MMKRMARPAAAGVWILLLTSLSSVLSEEGFLITKDDFGIADQQSWFLSGAGWDEKGLVKQGNRITAMDNSEKPSQTWWFSSSDFAAGDVAKAYNGWLSFELGHFESEDMGEGVQDQYDVVLVSKKKKFTVGLKGVFRTDSDSLSFRYEVRLDETFVSHGNQRWEIVNGKDKGRLVSKHEFVQCLSNVQEIRLRGSYLRGFEATWVRGVKIIEGLLDKAGRFEGMVQSGVADGGAEFDIVNGVKVYKPRSAAPSASEECCASKTCVGMDRYQLIFDRPGCMEASDIFCAAGYASSKAAQIVQGTDLNEGRRFFTPDAVPTACSTICDAGSLLCTDGLWDTGTKNQNIGRLAVPVTKPFASDYYLNSVPRICSAATLTVTAHGDLQYQGDSILVYGEDGMYLGALFTGNLSYASEGQRAYSAKGPQTQCNGAVRGGAKPGKEGDTACTPWVQDSEGARASSQDSVAVPYEDSIVIPQGAMLRYSADEQIRLTFKSERMEGMQHAFAGTGGVAPTSDCYRSGAATACDLDGKVVFRALKLSFSPGVCMAKRLFTDAYARLEDDDHDAAPLLIPLAFNVPAGFGGVAAGDAALSVVANNLVSESVHDKIEVFGCGAGNDGSTLEGCAPLGELFTREDFGGYQTAFASNPMLPGEEKRQLSNVSDALSISRHRLASLNTAGSVHLLLKVGKAAGQGIKVSPAMLTYPLMSCYLRSLSRGPHFRVFLERPSSHFFAHDGFPAPAGDVTFTVAAKWGLHSRYTGASACTLDGGRACGGNAEGMPKLRVDKDTVGDLGTVTVFSEPDGSECCPTDAATTITDLRVGAGSMAGCSTDMTLSASGGGGSGFAATVASVTSGGAVTDFVIAEVGTGYTRDPQLVSSSAGCTCTPTVFTCSSNAAASDAAGHATRGGCEGHCFNADGSKGVCCPPGSAPQSDGGIPTCALPTALPANVAGNLDACLRPVRTGCGGLRVCSASAASAAENTIRRQYPEMVEAHRDWPHGFSYLQLRAGQDGELLANLFLKDYSQYAPNSYYLDTVTIPKDVFTRSLSRDGKFEFTIVTPPGRSAIELASIVIGYPVTKAADAKLSADEAVDLTNSDNWELRGPAPGFSDTIWNGVNDPDRTSQATQSRFQTTQYQSG